MGILLVVDESYSDVTMLHTSSPYWLASWLAAPHVEAGNVYIAFGSIDLAQIAKKTAEHNAQHEERPVSYELIAEHVPTY